MMFPYKANIEQSMKGFYTSLCERDKRRYAAIEDILHIPIKVVYTSERYKLAVVSVIGWFSRDARLLKKITTFRSVNRGMKDAVPPCFYTGKNYFLRS